VVSLFVLIKIEGLDAELYALLQHEARVMAQLGDHPQIVSVPDLGDERSAGSGGLASLSPFRNAWSVLIWGTHGLP